MIEITLIPSIKKELSIVYEGHNARNLKFQENYFPKKYFLYRNLLIDRIRQDSFATNVPTKKETIKLLVNKFKSKSIFYRIIHNAWRMRLNLLIERVCIKFFIKEIRDVFNTSRNINLGGGFRFNYFSWLNFDE